MQDSGFLEHEARSLGEWLLMFHRYTMPSATVVKQSSWTSSVSSFKIPGTNYPDTHHHITTKWSSVTLFTSHSSNLCHDTLFPENCFYYHFHYCNEAPL